jgi:hypothetical protein
MLPASASTTGVSVQTWHTNVVKEYGAAKAAKELRAQGWKVEITRDQGQVRVRGVRRA